MRNQFGPFFLYVTFFSVFRLKLETLHVPTQPLLPESSLKAPFRPKFHSFQLQNQITLNSLTLGLHTTCHLIRQHTTHAPLPLPRP